MRLLRVAFNVIVEVVIASLLCMFPSNFALGIVVRIKLFFYSINCFKSLVRINANRSLVFIIALNAN